MATTTTNIGLVKPELSDNFNLQEHFNNNWDKVDKAFGDMPDLSTVATSGSYNDLKDKPVIPEGYDDTDINNRLTDVETNKADKVSLATVATSGNYKDLKDKPTIPNAYDDTSLKNRVSNVESELANKASYETGTISNYSATYDNNSKMNGSYALIGDLCFVMATATTKGGWADIDYPLPVAAVNNSACLATDGTKSYRVSTDKNNAHLYIHRVEIGEYQADGEISFTLIYKYK